MVASIRDIIIGTLLAGLFIFAMISGAVYIAEDNNSYKIDLNISQENKSIEMSSQDSSIVGEQPPVVKKKKKIVKKKVRIKKNKKPTLFAE